MPRAAYQSAEPVYFTGPLAFGPRIFSRQCLASISVRSEVVQNCRAQARCTQKNTGQEWTYPLGRFRKQID
jgi:hypothetical protein